jgi:hypothetical protein
MEIEGLIQNHGTTNARAMNASSSVASTRAGLERGGKTPPCTLAIGHQWALKSYLPQNPQRFGDVQRKPGTIGEF